MCTPDKYAKGEKFGLLNAKLIYIPKEKKTAMPLPIGYIRQTITNYTFHRLKYVRIKMSSSSGV
ncbi:MAG: hypothetical protein QXP27_08395 [Candidatus Methanomethyliaceae archaeon]